MTTIVSRTTQRIAMSREEYERLPEGPPFYDYIAGEAVEVNRPSGQHQDIVVCLTFVARRHVITNDLGMLTAEIDVALPTGDTVAPDIVFLSKANLSDYNAAKGDIYGTPDLVVEVHSPSTRDYDRIEKAALYYAAGVPWLWFVEQNSLAVEEMQWTVNGYVLTGRAEAGQTFRPTLFPGLALDLAALMGGGTF